MKRLLLYFSRVGPALRRSLLWSCFTLSLPIVFTAYGPPSVALYLAIVGDVFVGALCLATTWCRWKHARTALGDVFPGLAHLLCLVIYAVCHRMSALPAYPCLPALLHLLLCLIVSSRPLQLISLACCVVVPSVAHPGEFLAPVPILTTLASIFFGFTFEEPKRAGTVVPSLHEQAGCFHCSPPNIACEGSNPSLAWVVPNLLELTPARETFKQDADTLEPPPVAWTHNRPTAPSFPVQDSPAPGAPLQPANPTPGRSFGSRGSGKAALVTLLGPEQVAQDEATPQASRVGVSTEVDTLTNASKDLLVPIGQGSITTAGGETILSGIPSAVLEQLPLKRSNSLNCPLYERNAASLVSSQNATAELRESLPEIETPIPTEPRFGSASPSQDSHGNTSPHPQLPTLSFKTSEPAVFAPEEGGQCGPRVTLTQQLLQSNNAKAKKMTMDSKVLRYCLFLFFVFLYCRLHDGATFSKQLFLLAKYIGRLTGQIASTACFPLPPASCMPKDVCSGVG